MMGRMTCACACRAMDGRAERRAALDMLHRHSPGSTRQLTLGDGKGYDAAEFVADLRQACVTPHAARKAAHSAIDGRTTRHKGYALSQKHRKRIEEAFGCPRPSIAASSGCGPAASSRSPLEILPGCPGFWRVRLDDAAIGRLPAI
ncbi:hypothetical protein METH_23195 (plasmid) [Leisingera methylohalidivorans DSM 14336]|uniref:Transposase IS4-like domain-containing protein n=1 Tax=Leisingera methylohalidivorans DSM 14336 TaxID=999552 RepID=V9VYE9_9RHOB|nr:hypothetical protein METH_23195 [Leisingera methylohalidivorans DSM 14336]